MEVSLTTVYHPSLLQETLDADDTPLVDSQGRRMARDIVQFVPLRQFKTQRGANFSLVSGWALCGHGGVCVPYMDWW